MVAICSELQVNVFVAALTINNNSAQLQRIKFNYKHEKFISLTFIIYYAIFW